MYSIIIDLVLRFYVFTVICAVSDVINDWLIKVRLQRIKLQHELLSLNLIDNF